MRRRWLILFSLALALALSKVADAVNIVQPGGSPPNNFVFEVFGQTGASTNTLAPLNTTNGNLVNFKAPVVVSHICTWAQTADAVNNYDFGFYNGNGVLVADTGPVHPLTTNFTCYNTVQGTVTLSGNMTFAWTANSATARMFSTSNGECGFVQVGMTGGGTSGGQLNASGVTIPALNPAIGCIIFGAY